MPAHLRVSHPNASAQTVAGDPFLRTIIKITERLCSESETRGYALLSTLFECARAEAEDNLRTYGKRRIACGNPVTVGQDGEDHEGARRIAAKFVRGPLKR